MPRQGASSIVLRIETGQVKNCGELVLITVDGDPGTG
jgi:hypothetical protein